MPAPQSDGRDSLRGVATMLGAATLFVFLASIIGEGITLHEEHTEFDAISGKIRTSKYVLSALTERTIRDTWITETLQLSQNKPSEWKFVANRKSTTVYRKGTSSSPILGDMRMVQACLSTYSCTPEARVEIAKAWLQWVRTDNVFDVNGNYSYLLQDAILSGPQPPVIDADWVQRFHKSIQ